MSETKKTISIPSSVGSNNLSEVFGKINLSPEVKDLLASLDAELVARWIPGGEKPVVQVSTRGGKSMCTLEEFKALSGYRRFVSDALKELEKASSTDEKIKLVCFFLKQANSSRVIVPDRILEQNITKFNQVGSYIQVVGKHLNTIDETVKNTWKNYIQDRAIAIMRVLYSCQMACMGSTVVDKTYIEDGLFESGVPKWLYTKFLDKNFTNNLKDDSFTLLFPKGNFLKAISLTTKEIQNENFRKQNQLILQMSGGIITLAAYDFKQLFPTYPKELEEPVKNFLAGYQWVCTNPMESTDILALRETGKSIPVIRDVQPPKQSGRKQRPESDLAKTTRQITNVLNKIQGTWNSIMNFCIPVANPKTEFWASLFTIDQWVVTPTNSLYNLIRQTDRAIMTLDTLRKKPSKSILNLIGLIISQVLSIPAGTADSQLVVDALNDVENEVSEQSRLPDVTGSYPVADLSGYDPTTFADAELKVAREFLGVKKYSTKKIKKSGAAAVRLHTSVLNELAALKHHPIYDKVVVWLMTTFKTGHRHDLQRIAAERILGEALKHQEVIFEDDFEEEEALGEIEEYYEDEE